MATVENLLFVLTLFAAPGLQIDGRSLFRRFGFRAEGAWPAPSGG